MKGSMQPFKKRNKLLLQQVHKLMFDLRMPKPTAEKSEKTSRYYFNFFIIKLVSVETLDGK